MRTDPEPVILLVIVHDAANAESGDFPLRLRTPTISFHQLVESFNILVSLTYIATFGRLPAMMVEMMLQLRKVQEDG